MYYIFVQAIRPVTSAELIVCFTSSALLTISHSIFILLITLRVPDPGDYLVYISHSYARTSPLSSFNNQHIGLQHEIE